MEYPGDEVQSSQSSRLSPEMRCRRAARPSQHQSVFPNLALYSNLLKQNSHPKLWDGSRKLSRGTTHVGRRVARPPTHSANGNYKLPITIGSPVNAGFAAPA